MKKLLGIVALMLATAGVLAADDDKNNKSTTVPMVRSVAPVTVKAGDLAVATGEALDASRVSAMFLTDGKNDIEVVIVDQNEASIRFRVPAKIAPGRYFLMVLAKLTLPTLLEQPVALKVEEIQ